MEGDTLARVISVTEQHVNARYSEGSVFTAETAVCQDAYISGIDVDDFVGELETHFGKVVWDVPWGRYTDQAGSFRGCGVIVFPFWLLWRLKSKLLGGDPVFFLRHPTDFSNRLTLGHLAKVIDAGHWIEP